MPDKDRARRNELRHRKAARTQENIQKLRQRTQHIQFDFTRRVAIYARQSNFIQMELNEQSFTDQTEGQRQRAMAIGWREDQIDVITVDMDYTATTDIDDREGLSELLDKIKKGIYSAVIAYMEDRLFRDEYLDNATRFARACATNNCYLITERYTYDLSDEMERERFLMEVRFGWAYYKNQVLGHLHGHRESARRGGKYVGQYVSAGFTVCNDKESKYYRRLTPIPSHAAVIKEWCLRFVEIGGNFSQLCYEVRTQTGPHFPPIDDPIFAAKTRLQPYPGGGWRVGSKFGLKAILTSRVNIGDICIDGEWVEGHHEAIIDKELYYRILALFNDNPNPAPIRYKPTPLLLHQCGKFHGDNGGSVSYAVIRGGLYRVYRTINLKIEMWLSISAKVVEDAFFNLLLDNIAATEDFQDFATAASEVREKRDKQRAGIAENLAEVEARIALENAKMEAAKGHPNLQAIVTDAINEIALQMARKAELEAKLKNIPNDDMRLLALTDLLRALREHTHEFDIAALQELTVLAVKDVLLMSLTRHFILLRVEWEHMWPTQDVVIYRKLSGRDDPEPDELVFLKANFMTMDVNELLEAVPGMSLDSIMVAMKKEGLRRKNVPGALYKSHYKWRRHDSTGLKYDPRFSVEDYAVMERYGIALQDVQAVKERGVWKRQEYEVMAVSCVTNGDGSASISSFKMERAR
ncbi:MAG TPA: recombinase family protein [Ktedonobacteraceae bacterium]|nr:recombinase family protein [Ktedonobacteraceae bacterium]